MDPLEDVSHNTKEDLPLQILPDTVVYDMIMNTDDFSAVVNLYFHNRHALHLLSDAQAPKRPHLDVFLSPLHNENLPRNKLNILEHLNVKFQLGVIPPLAFPKLLRAYNRSAHHHKRSDYASILDCLHSAARLGSPEAFNDVFSQWTSVYAVLASRLAEGTFNITLSPLIGGQGFLKIMEKLATTAYKRNHLHLGDYICTKFVTTEPSHKRVYYKLKMWSRHYLAQYKVKRTRDILREHADTLFSPNVKDAVKVKIWASKYDLTNFPVLRPPIIKDTIWAAMLARIGRLRPPDLPRGLDHSVYVALSQLACLSGNAQSVASPMVFALTHRGDSGGGLRTILLHKRGFYGVHDLSAVNLKVKVWGKEVYPLHYCRKWSLSVIKRLGQVTDTEWTIRIIYGNASELYQKITAPCRDIIVSGIAEVQRTQQDTARRLIGAVTSLERQTISNREGLRILDVKKETENALEAQDCLVPHMRLYILSQTTCKLSSMDMINDIMYTASHFTWLQGAQKHVQAWIELNYALLVKIWKVHGRQQWEDCMLYLAVEYGCLIDPEKMLDTAIYSNALGLIEYIFRGDSPIMHLNEDMLRKLNIPLLVKSGVSPDTIMLLLDIMMRI